MKQTDIAKSEDRPKKTANDTTENKKTTGKISNGNGRNVPKAKERGKGQKQYKKGKKTAVVLAKQKYAGFWQSKLK